MMVKSPKRKSWRIYDEVYRFPILLVRGGTKEEAYRDFCKSIGAKKEEITHDRANGTFFWHTEIKGVCIWIDDFKGVKSIPILVHELLHATLFNLSMVGVLSPTKENDEHYCYYIQWLTRECLLRLLPEK